MPAMASRCLRWIIAMRLLMRLMRVDRGKLFGALQTTG
jgi:hypothetical protein